MGVPGSRAASPRLARTVRALPTAPADLPRARAISPGVCGPGLAARCAAVSRRSSPWPSRPVGVVRGAERAGGGRGGGGICGGHLGCHPFSLMAITGGYSGSPYFRVHHDAISPFRTHQPFSVSNSGRFAGVLRPESERECGKRPVKLNPAGPARSCVRTRRTGGAAPRPRAFRRPASPPPAPASPRPRPAWPASPCPASPGRGPGRPGTAPAGTRRCRGTQKQETGNIKRPPLTELIISRAPPHIVLQAWCCISLGVRRKVRIGRCLREGGGQGFPVSAGIPDGIRISWRKGTPAGSPACPLRRLVTAPGKRASGQ